MINFITNYYHLIIYIVIVAAFVVYSIFGLSSLSQFGYEGDKTRTVGMIYKVLSAVVIILTFIGLLLLGVK